MNQHVPVPVVAEAGARPPGERAKVFVSYSRQDMEFAETLVAALAARGFEALLDKTDIAPGLVRAANRRASEVSARFRPRARIKYWSALGILG